MAEQSDAKDLANVDLPDAILPAIRCSIGSGMRDVSLSSFHDVH
jgi:hypothetical protein